MVGENGIESSPDSTPDSIETTRKVSRLRLTRETASLMYHARHGSLTQILLVAGVSATNGTVQNLAAPTMADAITTVPSTSMNRPAPLKRWWSTARTSFFWMVFVAFALRVGWIVVAHTYKFKTLDDNFSFGWEMGRIGRSLGARVPLRTPRRGVAACARRLRPRWLPCKITA